jgi:hypothetical protein
MWLFMIQSIVLYSFVPKFWCENGVCDLEENLWKYVYECATSCNGNVLVLVQDLYMFQVPAVPIIRSTELQLTVTGITYITLDREMYGNIHLTLWHAQPPVRQSEPPMSCF